MIPALSRALPPAQPLSSRSFPTEYKAHILAIEIIASVSLLLAAPLEFAVPLSGCILFLSLFFLLPLCHAVSVRPAPLGMRTVQPIYVAPSSVYIPSPVLPAPRFPVAPGPRVPIRIQPPSAPLASLRAPVGTGGRTPAAPPPSVSSAVRAPVGGGARTPVQPAPGAILHPVRAPVGGR